MVKNSSAKYYQKNNSLFFVKKRLVKGIKNLLKEKKEWQYGRKRYKNLPEHEKQSLVGY